MLLMIDNYDSFTYNLVQYFAELGETVRVFRNDEIDIPGIEALKPDRLALPPTLRVTATSEDGEIMGVRHLELPIEGVQFHPESILSEHGHAMLRKFLETP